MLLKEYPEQNSWSRYCLHLRFAFLLVCNFCVFYQYLVRQCLFSSFKSQISQYDFFFLAIQVPLFISFHFFSFFPFEVFWFTECKFVLVLTFFFFKAQTSCRPNFEFQSVFTETLEID